jgi:hypothetical protein
VPAHAGETFFKAFEKLKLRPETQLYLGLIYGPEDRDGAERRIAMAAEVLPDFGIATRCGIARGRSTQKVEDLLDLHAALAR